MKKCIILVIIALFSLRLIHVSYAIGTGENFDRPEIDPGPGGGGSVVKILLDTLIGGKGVKVTYPDTPITPGVPTTPAPIDPGVTGNPVNTNAGQYANKVVAATSQYCGGRISSSNYNCVNNFASLPMNEEARQILKVSASKYTHVQCVAGARSMTYALDNPFTLYTGTALNFCNLDDPRYTKYPNTAEYRTLVKPGSLFIQDLGTYAGHIGYVTQVNGTNSIIAFEANWGAGTIKHGRQVPMVVADKDVGTIGRIICWQVPK